MQAQYAFHHPKRPDRVFVLDTAKRQITWPDGSVFDPPLSTTKAKLTGKTKVVRIAQLTDPAVRLLVLFIETGLPGAPIRNRDIMQLIWGDTIWLDKNPTKLRDAISRLHHNLGPEGQDLITPDRDAYRFHGVAQDSEASPYRIATSSAWDCGAGYFIRIKYQRSFRTNISMSAANAEFGLYREIFDHNPLGFNTIYRNNDPCGIFNVWPLRAQSAQALIDGNAIKWLIGPGDIHKHGERPFSKHLLIETAYAEKGPEIDLDALPVVVSHFPHMAAFVTNLLDDTTILFQATPGISEKSKVMIRLMKIFELKPVGPPARKRDDRLQVFSTTWAKAALQIAQMNPLLSFVIDEPEQED